MDWLDSRYPAWKEAQDLKNHKPSQATSDFSVEDELRYKDPGVTGWAGYPLQLGSLELGARFEMLNYKDIHMKVAASSMVDPFRGMSAVDARKRQEVFLKLYDAVLNTETNSVFWMWRDKPCRLVRRT
jgi:hypothetical protein